MFSDNLPLNFCAGEGGGPIHIRFVRIGIGNSLVCNQGEIFCLMGKLIGNSGKGWKQRKPLELKNAAA